MDFDRNSGSLVERLIFNHRRIVLAICFVITLALGFEVTHARLNANFERTLPASHPFVVNFLQHQQDLSGLGNAVRIVVESKTGTIYTSAYLQSLRKLSDNVFLIPGVDRNAMQSLWTPTVRWIAVTEQGFDGGPVIGQDYNGSGESIESVRRNVERSGKIGQIVAADGASSVIYVPLLSIDPTTSQPLDYGVFARSLDALRLQAEETGPVRIHITGFAQVQGDLINGVKAILGYFAVAVVIAILFLALYTRDLRSAALVLFCSLVAVLWQLGLITALGYALDPYSVLVPFLVFAIGMSHGAQKMNGIMQDIGRGAERLVAARYTFRRLFVTGVTALLCDVVGFAVLFAIPIGVIRDLAFMATLGVAILVITNLILLPVLLSYLGVSPRAAARSLLGERADSSRRNALWQTLDLFTRPRWAVGALVTAVLLAAGGLVVASHLTIGDLDPGAPELRPDSRYNTDAAYLTRHYGASNDVFAVMITTPDGACANYDTLAKADALGWELRQLEGVDGVSSLASTDRGLLVALTEGNLKWYDLVDGQPLLNMLATEAPRGTFNDDCDLLTVSAYLSDHRAETLTRVVHTVEDFAAANDSTDVKFLPAAGNAGIAAATNIVVGAANQQMVLWVYVAVIALCLVTFRSWRATLCAILPLALTSILAETLMVALHIGVKVSTLPVIALGVGIGVDYSLYIMSVTLARLREGDSLSEAYYRALTFTGRVVLLTGFTLAVGVATWIFSPIKFQADMGMLLAFMFLWNMLGALVLLPSLACFLLRPKAELVRARSSRIATNLT